jgi:hypothetical protein
MMPPDRPKRLLAVTSFGALVTRRYLGRGADSTVITFAGNGYYVASAEAVVVDVEGRWSHLPEPVRERQRYERHGLGLRRVGVGAECDASSTETYERVMEQEAAS